MISTKDRDFKIAVAIFIALAIAIIFNMKCASIPIQEKEAKQIAELESVKSDIQSSNLSSQAKDRSIKTIESSEKMIRNQGQTITSQEVEIKSLKWYEHLVWVVGLGLLAMIGFIAWRKFRNLSPL